MNAKVTAGRLLRRPPRRCGFTLVELLVVVSILGLLIAIVVPSLKGARRVAKRTACGTNLRSIGQAMRMYLNDSNDMLPVVEWLPSTPIDEDHPRPAIATVLRPFVEQDFRKPEDHDEEMEHPGNEVFKCPADVGGKTERDGDNVGKSYFETELSSYVFNTRLYFMRDNMSFTDGAFDKPIKLSEVVRSERARRRYGGQAAEEEVWLLRDYVPFHGKAGQQGSTNYLYVDGRVSDLER